MASIATSPSSWCNRAAFLRSRRFSASGIMRPLSSFVTFFCLASFCFVWAQTPPPASDDPTFRPDTRRLVLPVSVLNKDGKLVTDLQQKAFKVFENGVEQPIKIFRR